MDVLCSNLVCYQLFLKKKKVMLPVFFWCNCSAYSSLSLSLSIYIYIIIIIIINFLKKEEIYNKIEPSPFIRLKIQKRKGMKNIIHATEMLLIHDSLNLSNHKRMLFGNYMNDWAICLKLAYLLKIIYIGSK